MPTLFLTSNTTIQDASSPTSSGLHYKSDALVGTLVRNFYTFNTIPGTSGLPAYGDRWQITHAGTWAHDEKWGLIFTTTAGDFDIGSVNFFNADLVLRVCSTFKNRVYIGAGPQFNFSDSGVPDGWEQQNAGAGEVQYLSYFGGADSIYALSQLQGRLLVVARRSVQIWSVDADPNNFALVQEIDNLGSKGGLSVQNRGDYDVIMLDDTGFRSVRTMEVTLNAYLDDIGVPIDSLVQTDLLTVSAATCVSAVDPATKNYWGYLNGKIYVHARYPSSKISAWSTYLPSYERLVVLPPARTDYDGASTDFYTVVPGTVYKWTPGIKEVSISNGTTTLYFSGYIQAITTVLSVIGTTPSVPFTGTLETVQVIPFTPLKMVLYNGQLYVRGNSQEFLTYGGTDNNTYDGCVVTIALPWLDDKKPKLTKLGQALDAAISGYWHLTLSLDPISNQFKPVYDGVSPLGTETNDSTFDLLRMGISQTGTHFCIQATSDPTWHQVASISEVQFHYNAGNTP